MRARWLWPLLAWSVWGCGESEGVEPPRDAEIALDLYTLDLGGRDPSPTPDVGLEDAASIDEVDAEVIDEVDAAPPVGPQAPDYFILAPQSWRAAAEAYAAHRAGEHEVAQIIHLGDAKGALTALREALTESRAARPDDPLFVLLLGDELGADALPAEACENDLGGCYTDRGYGIDDGVIVGRVPAETPEQALGYLRKLEAHEGAYRPGLWNRRIVLYTGNPGFNPEVDQLLESVVMRGLRRVDHAFDIIGVYNNPNSPFYYIPFEDKVIELINGGSLFTLYIGHGSGDATDGLSFDNLHQIASPNRAPFFFLFACSTAEYYVRDDIIARALLWHPEGPITVMGASGISHPYANAVWPYELQREALDRCPETLGEAIIHARRAIQDNGDDEFRRIMSTGATMAGVLAEEQGRSLQQHLDLYNLYGDPAARLRCPPHRVALELLDGGLEAGVIHVEGVVEGIESGTAWLTFEIERDVILDELEPISGWRPDPEVVARNWAIATDKVRVEREIEFEGGRFDVEMIIGEDLPGVPYFLKAFAHDEAVDAIGALRVR